MTKGMDIMNEGRITENSDGSFSVPSQTSLQTRYNVKLQGDDWICTCPDNYFRNVACKHIFAIKFMIGLKTFIYNEPKPKVFAEDAITCDRCGSIRVMKYGTYGAKQVYFCKDCGHKFREPSLIKKARYSPEIITITLDLYFKGISLRKISDHLQQFYGLHVAFQTIWRWLDEYTKVMHEYVSTLVPNLSGKWHVDEMAVRVKGGEHRSGSQEGQWMWLWNVMDADTRFQLATEISKTKIEADGMNVLNEAKEIAKAIPHTIVTDKAACYPRAVSVAFANDTQQPHHYRVLGGAGQTDGNQRVERLHNTIRERNKTQRGWKTPATPLRKGQMIYYDFIRPHMTLEGKTPAEAAGLNVANGQNRWMELLKNSLREPESKVGKNYDAYEKDVRDDNQP